NPLIASTQITFAYRYVNEEPTIAYQHMSYDYISSVSSGQNEKNLNIDSENQSSNLCPHMPMNATLRLYIRQLLNDSKRCKPVPAKVGTQVQYIDPRSILYLNSCGHKTTLYCVDRIIECSMNIHEFDPYLPENFYPLRRGCIINVMYITAIRRSEVELAFGTVIQIPVPSFPKVKMELNELILQKDFK
ncbi:MAG: LytTR family DNA-binding domain-containing protein, partial [Lachnospiraceae bacterium]